MGIDYCVGRRCLLYRNSGLTRFGLPPVQNLSDWKMQLGNCNAGPGIGQAA